MSFWGYLVLFFTVILGGTVALYLRQYSRTALQLSLSFSGAYILGITILHLMPGVFSDSHDHTIGLWVILGFLIQLALEQLSIGVEHGHVHVHQQASVSFAVQIMIGLCLHAFIEGLPLSSYPELHQMQHGNDHDHNHLLIGIILHKAPAAFALVVLLVLSGFRRSFVIFCLIVFAAMSPLGALVSTLLPAKLEILKALTAIVIGSFLHISTTILFESDVTREHKISWRKMLVILAGIGTALLTLII